MISFIQIESYKSHNTSQFIYYDTKTNLIQINKNLRKGKCYTSLIILSILLLKISLILLTFLSFTGCVPSSLAFFSHFFLNYEALFYANLIVSVLYLISSSKFLFIIFISTLMQGVTNHSKLFTSRLSPWATTWASWSS